MAYVTMKQMLETGVHFGHQTRRWNPKMRPYIFGARNGIHIMDLQQTVKLFQKTHDKVVDTVAHGGKVIFIGTKRQAQESVKSEAERCGMYYVTNRWMGGTLTNFQTIRRSIDRLKNLETMFADGTINRFTKKEVLFFQREMDKLNQVLGGIKDMDGLPELAFVVDPKREDIAIKECRKLGISIAAIVDSNCDPDNVDYVIPGNDDAIRAIKLFVTAIADACLEGQAAQKDRDMQAQKEAQEAEAEKPEPAPEAAAAEAPAVQAPAEETPAATEEAASEQAAAKPAE